MTLPGRFTADNFTLAYWIGRDLDTVALRNGILLTAEFWQTVWNTLLIVGSASIVCGILGLLVGYAVMRCHSLALFLPAPADFLPHSCAGHRLCRRVSVAVCGRSRAGSGAVRHAAVAGTGADCGKMPYASRSGIAAMTQLGKEAEEAARIAGAGWFTRIRRIVVPVQAAPLATGILLPFISGIRASTCSSSSRLPQRMS